MKRSNLCSCSLLAGALVAVAAADDFWPDLACDGGGYWNLRVPVTVSGQAGGHPNAGMVEVLVRSGGQGAALIGADVPGLRVATADGIELKFGLVSEDGVPRREGSVAVGDRLFLPLQIKSAEDTAVKEIPTADAKAIPAVREQGQDGARGAWRQEYFVYAGNRRAWCVPEWLGGTLQNTGFEVGAGGPEGWTAYECDDRHRMVRQKGGARSGDWCARCEVDEGAKPDWVKYMQSGMPIRGSARYRFTGWVKAKDVKGRAGWYVHVHGQGKLLLNRTTGEGGTYDWRKTTFEFTVSDGASTFSVGTVLHGTGTAWYDDVSVELLGGAGAPGVQVGAVQRRKLRAMGRELPWPRETTWAWRAPLTVRYFGTKASSGTLVNFDCRRFYNQVAKALGFGKTPALRLVDPRRPGAALPVAGSPDTELYAVLDMLPATELTLWLYLSEESAPAGASPVAPPDQWSDSRDVNLLVNGGMSEGGAEGVVGWTPTAPHSRRQGVEEARVNRDNADPWCLRLQVPESVSDPGWPGWRQIVDVQPSTRYLLAGELKTDAVDGDARIHGHLHRADGKHTANAFLSTGDGLSGTCDWTRLSTLVTTPPDCARLSVHLTMNAHGTVWHDNVFLARVEEGLVGNLESRRPSRGLEAWSVNPLVKVFREDVAARQKAESVSVHVARNTRRGFQLALRAGAPTRVSVSVGTFKGPDRSVLDAIRVYRVDYVPIDFPIGYAGSEAPGTHRLRPTHRGNDGWAGLWPDPLVPLNRGGSIELRAGETQPLWFDVAVPADATPGEYTGSIALRSDSETFGIPVSVRVWPFAMPDHPRLPAIYDLRNGPGVKAYSATDKGELWAWCAFLADYNVSPGMCVVPPKFSFRDGRVVMDTAEFDAFCTYLFEELGVARLYTPWIFYACGWAREPKKVLGFEAFSEDYNRAWTSAYDQFVRHITKRGWRKRFVFYISDEPHAHSERTITGLARLADMARGIAPDVPIYSSTWRYIEGLEDHITLWGIGIHGSFPQAKVDERRAKGDRFWYTTDGHMCTDTPYLAVETLLPWFCFKYGCGAYEFWGVSWWTHDPWVRGWHTFIRQSSDGIKYRWVRYPNGDGFLAYPGEPHGVDGPLPCIRLLAAREGVDDYEVFCRLREQAEAGSAEARKVLERVRSLVTTPNRGGRYSTDIMPDPDAVLAVRVAAGETLSRLSGGRTEQRGN